MSSCGLLPSGGVALPPEYRDPPLDPKYKAIILYLMYFAERAWRADEFTEEMTTIRKSIHVPASKLLRKVHKVYVHPESIHTYYHEVMSNLKKGDNCNLYAFAQIISRQVQDERTLEEVFSFLLKCTDEWDRLTRYEQLVLQMLMGATRSTDGRGPSQTYTTLVSFIRGMLAPKDRHLPDPELKSFYKLKWETSIELRVLNEMDDWFEEHAPSLSEVTRRRTDPTRMGVLEDW